MKRFVAVKAERYTTSKQCLRIYKDHFCSAKYLLGNTQTLELHPVDAGCMIASQENRRQYG